MKGAEAEMGQYLESNWGRCERVPVCLHECAHVCACVYVCVCTCACVCILGGGQGCSYTLESLDSPQVMAFSTSARISSTHLLSVTAHNPKLP